MTDAPGFPATPRLDGLDRSTWPFWAAAADGRLVIQRCQTCREAYFYPRPFCPFCFSSDVAWIDASGRGTVYTYTVVRQATPSPSVIAYVTLEEGPSILTRLDFPDPRQAVVGAQVRASFATGADGRPLLLFAPA